MSKVVKTLIPHVRGAKDPAKRKAAIALLTKQVNAGHYSLEDWSQKPVRKGKRKGVRVSVTRWETDAAVKAVPHGLAE